MIIPSEIKYIIHQIREYNGADARYTQLKCSKFPEIILQTLSGKILKNIQPRELGFYLQLGKFGHANVKPSIWFFSNTDGKLAAIVYHWDINPPISIDIKKDGAFVGVPEALASLNGVVNANHHSILESVNSDDVTLVLPKITGDFASDYCYNWFTSTIGQRVAKTLVGSDLTHWFIKFGLDLNGIVAGNFFEIASLQYVKIKHNGVIMTPNDPLALNGSGPSYINPISSTVGAFNPGQIQGNVPFETAAYEAGDPGILSINFQVPRRFAGTLAGDYTITSNVAFTISAITIAGNEWAFKLTFNAALPIDGTGFVNFQDVAAPPPPGFDTTLTIDLNYVFGSTPDFRAVLGVAIDGIVHINQMNADGFFPGGCAGSSVASVARNINSDILVGATGGIIARTSSTGNWNLTNNSSYRIYNVFVNGAPRNNGDIVTIGTKKVKIVLRQCIG